MGNPGSVGGDVVMEGGCENCGKTLPPYAPITRRFMFEARAFCSGKCAAQFDETHEDPFSWVTLENLDIFATRPEGSPRTKPGKEVTAAEAAA